MSCKSSFEGKFQTSELQKLLTEVSDANAANYYTSNDRYNGKGYSKEGFWAELTKSNGPRDTAQKVLNSPISQRQINAALKDLQAAKDNLILSTCANTTLLHEELLNEPNKDTYTPKTWATYNSLRSEAEIMMASMFDKDGKPTVVNVSDKQPALEKLAGDLKTAREKLEERKGEYGKTKAEFCQSEIRYFAEKFDPSKLTGYTEESLSALCTARKAALKAAEAYPAYTTIGKNELEELQSKLEELRKACYQLREDPGEEQIKVQFSAVDATGAYTGRKQNAANTQELTLAANTTVGAVLNQYGIDTSLAYNNNYPLLFLNGKLYFGFADGYLGVYYKDIVLHDGDKLTAVHFRPKMVTYSSTAGQYPTLMDDARDWFRYSEISAPETVMAGQPFTITVTSDGALAQNHTGAASPVSDAAVYTSAAFEDKAEAGTADVLTPAYVSTGADGTAQLTLYAEGWTAVNAFRLDDEGRYTVGPTVLVYVTASDDLSAIKAQLREELNAVYYDENYPESSFSPENWKTLTDAYNAGVSGIESAETSGAAREAQMTALQTIKQMQKTADSSNRSNLETFRKLLSGLPEDVSKLDENAADTIEKLKKAYEAMTDYQRGELTAKEKARYQEIINAKLGEAREYQLKLEQAFEDVPEADQATLNQMIQYLMGASVTEDYKIPANRIGPGGNVIQPLFKYQVYENGSFVMKDTSSAMHIVDIYVNPDYTAYLPARNAQYGVTLQPSTSVSSSGNGWSIIYGDARLQCSGLTAKLDGHLTYTVNDHPYEIRSITVDGVTDYSYSGAGYYDWEVYAQKTTDHCNMVIPNAELEFTMPFNDVTVTVTWGPAGGTSSEVETARAKALALLDAEYAKYQAHENYETTIKAAYDAGKAAISAATTVDAINTARAKALRDLAKAAAGTDGSQGKLDARWTADGDFDAGNYAGKVTVIFENTTCNGENLKPNDAKNAAYFYKGGKPFLTVNDYAIGDKDSMMTVILRALADYRYSWDGTGSANIYEINYLASISYTDDEETYTLAQFTGGNESGWMGTLNDFFVNTSFRDFTAEAGKLADGDVIRVMYTTTGLGADIGGSWYNSDTTLKSLEVEGGDLTSAFASGVPGGSYDYTLAIDGDSANIKLTPTAANKNYLVRTYLNVKDTGAAEGSALYKRTESIPVTAGDVIYVGCGEQAWPSMNNQETEARDYTGTWYALHVISRTGSGSEVNNQITALPAEDSLSYDNRNLYRDQIEDAKHNLDNLDPEAAKNIAVENQEKLDALLAKLDAYDALDELKAELQGMTLPAIGRMTDQAKMEKLLNAYNNAANSEELRQYLTDAEKNKADAIKARLDTLAAEKVISAIDAIGPVTKDSGAAIKAARDAYNELTDAQKKLVTNYDKLTAAEARWSELNPIPAGQPAQLPQNPNAGATLPFTDVSANNWYYSGVKFAYEKGLMNGTGNGTFSPNADTTRGMIVTMLARLEGVSTSGTPWYAAGQKWAMDAGISDGTNMTGAITREQLAAILFRYAKQKGYDVSKSADLNGFADANTVSTYATDAMRWAAANGLIQGSNSKLNPKGTATRAQVATILMRFMEVYAK